MKKIWMTIFFKKMHNLLALCGIGSGVCVAFSCSKVIVVTLRPWAKGGN